MRSKFFRKKYLRLAVSKPGATNTWREICEYIQSLMLNCKYLIGYGHNTLFWLDHWFLDGPLIEHAIEWPTSFPLISEVLDAEGNWNLSNVFEFLPEEIIQSILSFGIQP